MKMDWTELKYTGERLVPDKSPQEIYQEHIERYIFAVDYTKDKIVLDVACGTGYGITHISKHGALAAVGVDFSMESLSYAGQRYGKHAPVSLVCADAIRLPFGDNSFDVIVSFETIEHLSQYPSFLEESRRLLNNDGLFICSTPNKKIFSPNVSKPPNPFHVIEFMPEEFSLLVRRYYTDITIYGQCDVNLLDNSVKRNCGVRSFNDNELVSSAYMIVVARK